MNINIADNLKRLRRERNLTQEELAERVGVSGQAVSKWERTTLAVLGSRVRISYAPKSIRKALQSNLRCFFIYQRHPNGGAVRPRGLFR